MVAMMRGEAWVVPDIGDVRALRPGDVAIMRGPDPYTVADDPATPPQVIIHPGQHCTTAAGEDVSQAMDLGVRTWGNSPHGSATMLIGTYRMRGEISQRLLAALPALVVLPDDALDSPLMALLGDGPEVAIAVPTAPATAVRSGRGPPRRRSSSRNRLTTNIA